MRLAFIAFALMLLAQHEVRANCPGLDPDTLRWISKPQFNQELSADAKSHSSSGRIGVATAVINGLKQFIRIDLPDRAIPGSADYDGTLSAVFFVHGWVPESARRLYQMGKDPGSYYGPIIQSLADAGFVVISPFLRGHGFSETEQADGIRDVRGESLQRDYARDILALWLYRDPVIRWLTEGNASTTAELTQTSFFGHSMGAGAIADILGSSCFGTMPSRVPVVLWAGTFAEVNRSEARPDSRFVVWILHGDRDRFVGPSQQQRFHDFLVSNDVEAYYEQMIGRNHEFSVMQSSQLAADPNDAALSLLLKRTASFLRHARYQP
ncbi:MAG: hypothetical protein EBU87_09815 [Betaproteobacteria bacterium]|nr:hypothetical protein [Betaproteobacteria bacterium]NBP11222.1 hypothetical protein [Betaproteobacteria bacterium]NCV06618.1 hypothetical protein [Betaproteobacteria bacterium]NCY19929.1 hypothetical protein [Betaproteobacteria bacterium]NCZ81616.1 hypothetical protein [Betaproteobacteria bacterium]